MKLFIDTSSSEKVVIGLGKRRCETERPEQAQMLLPFIVDTLEKEGKTVYDISQVEIYPGPGSFTGLRVGAAVGNALAWALNIPGYFTRLKY